jgi:muconolactone delta-isomerase
MSTRITIQLQTYIIATAGYELNDNIALSEVLTAVVMKSYVFQKITPLKAKRRFGEIFHLNFHGRRISQGRNRSEST